MGYIFISYSHLDQEYVHKLQEALKKKGFEIWIDDRIDYASEWPKIVQDHVDKCEAFILVMSENSDNSSWVHNEAIRADRLKKPIFPLLLSGKPWLIAESRQYEDVRDSSLPRARFFEDLSRIIAKSSDSTHDPPSPPTGFREGEKEYQTEPVPTIGKQVQPNSESRSTKIPKIAWFGKQKDITRRQAKSHDITSTGDKVISFRVSRGGEVTAWLGRIKDNCPVIGKTFQI